MDALIEAIRVAVAPDAPNDARAAGAAACRTILTTLDAQPGEQMVTAVLPEPAQLATLIGAMRGVPTEQLLDLAIAKVRSDHREIRRRNARADLRYAGCARAVPRSAALQSRCAGSRTPRDQRGDERQVADRGDDGD
jgi:hypothetical protein